MGWTKYECKQKTIDGWNMAQRRYDEMGLWDRIRKRPLADVIQDAPSPTENGVTQYADGNMRGVTEAEIDRGRWDRDKKHT